MSKTVDVCIIGGGIHGVGVAQAMVAAGYSVVVLEQASLASGTSSRSSKLIHGGLRYLESAQFNLVYHSLAEREILLRIAPDLVHLTPFYIPIYRETTRRPWQIRAGLSLYALLGKLHRHNLFHSLAKDKWTTLDGLQGEGLQRVFCYWDAQTDDALLTRAVMKSAESLGAELICPAEFVAAEVSGLSVEVTYRQGDMQHNLSCAVLINAAGPWVNHILDKIPVTTPRPMDLVQGTHLILKNSAPTGIYYVEAPQDRRAVFIMPWKRRMMIGTTETVYHGNPREVVPLEVEKRYLLKVLHQYFPAASSEVIDAFAGLRVLPGGEGSVFNRARDTVLYKQASLPRLLTLYGGKLTAYRTTAQKVLAEVLPLLPARQARGDTARMVLAPE